MYHMELNRLQVVTGAFGYSGRHIAARLLESGARVRTLTNSTPDRDPFSGRVEVRPLDFGDHAALVESLRGAEVLYNTYWVRFNSAHFTFAEAVNNSLALFAAAQRAGVRRIVHVSIANPSLDSPLGYYRGKAQVEEAVKASGLSYTILRPTVIFGAEDILINNIAWFLRHFPVFGIPGDGRYGIRPIYVEDMAELLADAAERETNATIDAVGPETFAFEELVQLIARAIGASARLMHLPAPMAYASTRAIGWFTGDVILTWEEYRGLMGNLLVTEGLPAGKTRLSEWLAANGGSVGRQYASELSRHYRKQSGQ